MSERLKDWIVLDLDLIAPIATSVVLIIATLMLFIRIFGLRASSKMSGFDFAVTIAFGSVLAGVITAENPSVLHGAVALFVLFCVQFGVAWARRRSRIFSKMIDNEPRLVFHDGDFIYHQMRKAEITEEDVLSKIRTAGARHLGDVAAVVMETTGDISVIMAGNDSEPIDRRLLDGVLGWPRDNSKDHRK